MIGKHRWEVDRWFIFEDPIYDMDNESSMEENLNWNFPLSISIGIHFMVHEEDIAGPISLGLGQPKDVEVCDALFIIDQHPGVLINGGDFF